MDARPAIPRAVWALGLTSMLMDVSSEMIHALLPIYLTAVLGVSMATVGWIEGVAEATALATKIFSGALSDRFGKRKALALAGYAMAAVTKPVFPLASGAGEIVAARFMDRIGKGVRGAPRDALIADVTDETVRGAAFGLRQSLDTIGAFIGPMLAIGLMLWSVDNYRLVFWLAAIPAFLSVAVLALGVVEPDAKPGTRRNPLSRAALRRLPRAFWLVVAFGAALSFARVSEAFLILRATDNGLPAAFAPAVLAGMSVVYAAGAWPAGVMADRLDRRALLVLATVSLALAEAVLALNQGLPVVFLGVALWGAHLALSQGLLAALVADTAPADLRATGFGMFHGAGAVAILAGNVFFGAIWTAWGASLAFGLAAACALAATPLAVAYHRAA